MNCPGQCRNCAKKGGRVLNQKEIDCRLCFRSQGPEDTREVGEFLSRGWVEGRGPRAGKLGPGARAGLVISLGGELGAGKTVFVKGLARGMGVDEELVSSPTFVLANQYLSPSNGLVLHHVDFYRLEAAGELESIGFFDMMGPGTLLVVEWGPKFLEEMPEDRLEVTIDVEPGRGPEERIFRARGTGPESRGVAEEWGRRLSAIGGRALLEPNADSDAHAEPDPSPGEGAIGK